VYMHAAAVWNTPQAQLMTRLIPVWAQDGDADHSGETPIMTPMPAVLGPMMWNSSNRMANACLDFWGIPTIEAIVKGNFGVSNATQIRNRLGIGAPYNPDIVQTETNLVDLGALYENVNAKLGATKRNFFRTYMLNDVNSNGIDQVATDERAAVGLTNAQFAAWRAGYTWHAKAGSNSHPTNDINGYTSIAGWLQLPFRSRTGTVTFQQYVFGNWVNGAVNKNDVGPWTIAQELIRDEVRASMQSFKN